MKSADVLTWNGCLNDAVHYLKVFTFIPVEEINEIEKEHLANLGARIAQKRLAYEVVKIVHSEEDAEEAKKMSEVLFSNNFASLKEESLKELFANAKIEVKESMKLEDLLIFIKAASSKREAREFIKNNAVSVNGEKVNDALKEFNKNDALFGKYLVVKRGKKNYYLVEIAY